MNPKFRRGLTEIIDEAGGREGLPKSKGLLLYYLAGKARGRRELAQFLPQITHHALLLLLVQYPANALVHRPVVISLILGDSIKVPCKVLLCAVGVSGLLNVLHGASQSNRKTAMCCCLCRQTASWTGPLSS